MRRRHKHECAAYIVRREDTKSDSDQIAARALDIVNERAQKLARLLFERRSIDRVDSAGMAVICEVLKASARWL